MRRLALAVLVFPLLAVACGGASQADIDAVKALTGDSVKGKDVFEANCKVCHGDNATSGTAGKDLPHEAKEESDEVISRVLTGEDEMPAFKGTLTNQQIADVVAYLKSL